MWQGAQATRPDRHGRQWEDAGSVRTQREPRAVCARARYVPCTPGCSAPRGWCVMNAIDKLGGSTKKVAPPRRRRRSKAESGAQKKKRA
ncbi:hypothetical protein N9L68_02005 [bacterium]|nr:hypothetical protein [bacterium]